MNEPLLYFLKLSICITICCGFYFLFLRKLTFFNLNRAYLLGVVALSFLLPLVDISSFLKNVHESQNLATIPSILEITGTSHSTPQAEAFHFSWEVAAEGVIALGMAYFSFRVLLEFLSYRKTRLRAILISRTDVHIYHIEADIIPFSFGRSIFLNRNNLTEAQFHEVICHETVHVRQRHSIDIILAEILCCINWYNPFAWLLSRSIRQNLEFIADHQSLLSGSDRKSYQYLLLSIAGGQQIRLANQFNFSPLKTRIAMMNAKRSSRLHAVGYALIVPLTAVILMSFRSPLVTKKTPSFPNLQSPTTTQKAPDLAPRRERPNRRRVELPPGFTLISAGATKEEVRDFIAILSRNRYTIQLSIEKYENGKLVELSGVLGGKPFDTSLTGPMHFQITNSNAAILGVNPENARLYWYHEDKQ